MREKSWTIISISFGVTHIVEKGERAIRGTPIEITGIPMLFSLMGGLSFPNPEPGISPALVICMEE